MASAPVMNRAQYSDLFGVDMLPVLEELFRAEFSQHPSRRGQLFKQRNTDRDIWQYSEMHDLPLFSQVPEGTEYSFERAKQGFDKTLSIVKFGSGFSISMEAVEDGKFDMISSLVKKLARSGRESQEIQAMSIFNNGFGSETTADGVSLFNTSHPLPSGGSYRNRLTTDADLSESSLQTMLSDFETEFVGDTGIIEDIRPTILLAHSDNKRLAKELTGSDLKPDTADNNINAIKEDGLSIVTSPHLTDTDAWYLLAPNEDTGLVIVNRSGMQTMAAGPDVGFMTDSVFYKARYREKIGALNGYGVFGSSGA